MNNRKSAGAVHGGRVYEAARRWGIAPEEVVDFSANINPFGPPPGVMSAIEKSLEPVNLRSYPDSHAFSSAVAEKHGVNPDEVVVGPGSAALMFAVLRATAPASAIVLEPCFDEYSRACAAVDAQVTRLRLTEENDFAPDFGALTRLVEARRRQLLILNSPHNPTGRLYRREDMTALLDAAEANSVAVLLDEAFIDYTPQASLVALAASKSRLVVLRSLTKFYAIPGLRVGYAVCAAELAAALQNQLDAWPVSTVALEAGRAALYQKEYEMEIRRANEQSREEFAAALREIGLSVFPSEANFLLVKLSRGSGAELARRLESSRILIRSCDSFSGMGDDYIRLAVRSREDNLRLVSLVEAWLGGSDRC
ncbi:MAG TPA: threonine-phosphate decarboxylase CobD [Blastocatellia bacterium]|nr:threonine-phosphate decarboxylase CobD [Blastocatellia bacterium]